MTIHGISIVGWQVISALGVGAQALRAAPPGEAPAADMTEQYPQDVAYRPARFDTAALIGTKGIRSIDRTTALALCTARLLHGDQPPYEGEQSERTGFVLGTSTGSIRSTSDFTRDSLIQERPFLVNPAHFPNTVMNCAAGQCAIRFKARAVNATISGGRLSGLLALQYASQMLRRGYADRLLTGAVEELCEQTAWAHRGLIQLGKRQPVPLGEGCAMFALERTTPQREGADILALRYGRYSDPVQDDAVDGALACIGEALGQAGIDAADLVASCLCGAAEPRTADIERRAIERLPGTAMTVHQTALVEGFGDTYSATFALALCHLLTCLERAHEGSAGMVLATTDDGHVGCLIVRRAAARENS